MMIDDLLDNYKELSPFYQNYKLVSHLPMALISLSKIGATSSRLREYAEHYINQHALKKIANSKDITGINNKNWLNYLGQYSAYSSYLDFFKSEYDNLGKKKFLSLYLSKFMTGFAAHAYHPMIRLALSLDVGDDSDIPYAFSYWAAGFWQLPGYDADIYMQSPDSILNYIKNCSKFDRVQAKGANIEERLKNVLKAINISSVPLLDEDAHSLTAIANALAQLYFSTENFTVLHGITSCHALRTLLPYFKSVKDRKLAISHYWLSISVVYIMLGCPKFEMVATKMSQQLPGWDELFKLACMNNDAHVIKLIYSCYEEYCYYENDLYQAIAAQKLRLL